MLGYLRDNQRARDSPRAAGSGERASRSVVLPAATKHRFEVSGVTFKFFDDAPEVRVFAKRATGCRPWHSGCTAPVPVEESADVGDE